jgi:zinc transport system substrate-binding protein
LFPEFKNEILKNEKQYLTELRKIEEEIYSKISKVQGKRIATFHNAWNYFAEELGVKVVATFEEYPGEEPTALYLKNFSEKIKDNKLKVVFTEPQFSTKALLPIAKDLGVTIIEIDPIGGLPERDSFIKLMKYNVLEIEKALSNQ